MKIDGFLPKLCRLKVRIDKLLYDSCLVDSPSLIVLIIVPIPFFSKFYY